MDDHLGSLLAELAVPREEPGDQLFAARRRAGRVAVGEDCFSLPPEGNAAEPTALELAAAYHERWEIELVVDELKTHQRGPAAILRSRKPDLVEQEIWGLLITHYGIRHLMREAADQADLDPDRLSFIRSLRVIRRQVSSQAAFPPQRLQAQIRETIAEILERPNPERRKRSCPRAVKRTTHHAYRMKRATDKNIRHDSPPTIRLYSAAA